MAASVADPQGRPSKQQPRGWGRGAEYPNRERWGPRLTRPECLQGSLALRKARPAHRAWALLPAAVRDGTDSTTPQPLQLQLSISGGLSRRGSGSHALLPHSAHHSLRLPSGSGWGVVVQGMWDQGQEPSLHSLSHSKAHPVPTRRGMGNFSFSFKRRDS